MKQLYGTIMRDFETFSEMDYAKTNDQKLNGMVHDSFDAWTAVPQCASVSGRIQDPSSYGSCWAFGSTKAFNDRRCIDTSDTTLMSVEDITADCGFFSCLSMGCNRVARTAVAVVHGHWRRHRRELHGHRQ